MRVFLVLCALSWALDISGQVIPELISGDHYRPYLSEGQKRGQIIGSRIPNSKSGEELYPELYKNTHEDYLGPIRGTAADPANAFKNYSQQSFGRQYTQANNSMPQSAYNNSLSIQQRSQAIIDADMAEYEVNKVRSQQLIAEAMRELESPVIVYNLGKHNSPTVEPYDRAYSVLDSMLTGTKKVDFLKAVWLVESAADPSVSWKDFNRMFQDGVQVIQQLMVQDKLSPKDNLAKIMAVYKYMSDTTKVFIASREKTIVSKPMLYDFEDYAGKNDPTKVFVSKLLRTGTGQCMSLPMLYYLYAKALRADVNLAFAPEHTYITFKDNLGKRQNIELTGRMFTSADFHWQNGFVKTEQVKSGIYLTPISENETISYLLTTLALTYVKTFGMDNRAFDIAITARKHHPNSLTANMLLFGYSNELWKHVQRQYEVYGMGEEQFQKDANAQAIKQNREAAYNHIVRDLGYSKMPEWAYQAWLNSVNELANRRQHIVRRRQLEQQLSK